MEQILADAYLFYKFSNLTIYSPSDEGMLALKIASGRGKEFKDLEDSAFLIKKLRLRTVVEVKDIVDRYKPGYWSNYGYEEKFCKEALDVAYSGGFYKGE